MRIARDQDPSAGPEEEPFTLTRDTLSSDFFRGRLRTLPAHLRWSIERIRDSLSDTLRRRPPGEVWLFGYGSLIWNPVIRYTERRPGVLEGWSRSFCLRLLAGRATPEALGRMLGLLPGERTGGLVFRLPEATLEEELSLVWTREMLTGAYRPMWLPIELTDAEPKISMVFVSECDHPFFETDTSIATIAPLIMAASGPLGTNAEYVFRLAAALGDLGFKDDYIETLVVELQRLAGIHG
jgi:cation transport protein ChaC